MSTSSSCGPGAERRIQRRGKVLDAVDAPMRQPEARGQQRKVRRAQRAVNVAGAVLRILNVADDPVGLVVHENEHDLRLLLDRGEKLREVHHGAAVSDQRNGLAARASERRPDRHGNALPDAAAERVDAEMGRPDRHIAVAEGRVGDRDIAHERMLARGNALEQDVRHDVIGTELLAQRAFRAGARHAHLMTEARIDIEPLRQQRKKVCPERRAPRHG